MFGRIEAEISHKNIFHLLPFFLKFAEQWIKAGSDKGGRPNYRKMPKNKELSNYIFIVAWNGPGAQ
jgi:hypothetical protein